MALIRLRICAGWSKPLLVAHTGTLLEISCSGSYGTVYEMTECVDALYPSQQFSVMSGHFLG